MQKILLVDDEPAVGELVKQALQPGIEVVVAAYLSEVKALLSTQTFDLFILDLTLSDCTGYQICSMIKKNPQHSNTPVFFLTGDASEHSQVAGFTLGADDYIVKPFSIKVFRARILRQLQKKSDNTGGEPQIKWKNLILLPLKFEAEVVEKDGRKTSTPLTSLEVKILTALLRHPGKVIPRKFLIDQAWGIGFSVGDRVVDQHICSLRRKLKIPKEFVKTIYGVGYQLCDGEGELSGEKSAHRALA